MTTPTTPTTAELLTALRAALADLDNATDRTDAYEDATATLADAARDLDKHLTRHLGLVVCQHCGQQIQRVPVQDVKLVPTVSSTVGAEWMWDQLRTEVGDHVWESVGARRYTCPSESPYHHPQQPSLLTRQDMRAQVERTVAVGDLIGPDPLTVLYWAADADETAVLDTLTVRAGLIWECRLCDGYRNPHDTETCEGCGKQRTWPRRTLGGDTVWACCVSSIGPKCGHPRGTITWEGAGGKPGTTGRIPTSSEGTVIICVDGKDVIGIDLRAGTVFAWPHDPEENEVVARFTPVPDPTEQPEPTGPQAE